MHKYATEHEKITQIIGEIMQKVEEIDFATTSINSLNIQMDEIYNTILSMVANAFPDNEQSDSGPNAEIEARICNSIVKRIKNTVLNIDITFHNKGHRFMISEIK